jgi:hydroxymethylbilane synthase
MTSSLVIGSRGSKLALAQTELVRAQLSRLNPLLELRIEIIKTTGDATKQPLSLIGGKGVFTRELEEALLDGRIDVAVHSLKDLPTIIPDELQLSAICIRETAFDALALRRPLNQSPISIHGLPPAAVVGTSSPRRTAQLKHLRPDLVIKDVRGNIDTRFRKLDDGEYDALVLAVAGLRRLKLADRISAIIPSAEMLPAIGQGAIGLETRANDQLTNKIAAAVDDEVTRLECTAERSLLRTLGGGCQLPIAGHATITGGQICLEGLVADVTGTRVIRDQLTGTGNQAQEIGAALGQRLLEQGALKLLSGSRDSGKEID